MPGRVPVRKPPVVLGIPVRRSKTGSDAEEDLEVDIEGVSDNEETQNEPHKKGSPKKINSLSMERRSLRSSDVNVIRNTEAPITRKRSVAKAESDPETQPKEKQLKIIANSNISPRKTRSRTEPERKPSPKKLKIDLRQPILEKAVEVQNQIDAKAKESQSIQVPAKSSTSASSTLSTIPDQVPSTSGIQMQNGLPNGISSVTSPAKTQSEIHEEEDDDVDDEEEQVPGPLEEEYYACTICFRAFRRLIECNVHTKMEHAKEELLKQQTNPDGNHSFLTVGKKTPSLVSVFNGGYNERTLTVLVSRIHGKGLFTSSFIPAGEIIIEYTGEIINKREALERQHYYDDHNLDHYIMRMGRCIIDATVKGNCSKYINNSCDPNCETEQVEVLGKRRVLIYSTRDIVAGEELTYNYKFTSDELIPCNCSSPNCRKFINSNLDGLKLKNEDEISKLVESLVGDMN